MMTVWKGLIVCTLTWIVGVWAVDIALVTRRKAAQVTDDVIGKAPAAAEFATHTAADSHATTEQRSVVGPGAMGLGQRD